jgi:hypothetical protein
MARHVPAIRELRLGRRDLLDASTVTHSLNALPGFKTSAGELHVHEPSFRIYLDFSPFGICGLCEGGRGRRPTELYLLCKLFRRKHHTLVSLLHICGEAAGHSYSSD